MANTLYSFQTARKIVSGPGSLDSIGDLVSGFGAKKAAILTDPGIVKTGLVDRPKALLEAAGLIVDIVAGVIPEPPVGLIEELYAGLKDKGFDLLVGIGGGSSLDVTKILSVRLTSGCPVQDFMGPETVKKPGLPMVLIPTTAGTGSEVTPNAIVTLPDQELKAGIVSHHFLPDLVILDPMLTLGLPKHITAATGMDAFIHSLESFISKKANPFSDTFALRSMGLIGKSIRKAYFTGGDVEARHDMLVGSMLGGMALTAAGTAAVHALAYPLGGKFGIPHGVANSMLLLPVMEFNFEAIIEQLAEVAGAMGLALGGSTSCKAQAVMDEIGSLVKELEIPQSLQRYGVKEQDLDALAAAASQVTRLLGNNPKAMSVTDIKAVYSKIL